MRKLRKINGFVFILALLFILTENHILSTVEAQTVGNFRLDEINWLGARDPGASDVPLQFQIMNLHNETITSVFGILSLSYPFTDSTDGDKNATAVGEALSTYINVSQYIIVAGEPFELIYNLDIDDNAIKGFFNANLTLTYFKKTGTGLTPGIETVFELKLEIPNTPPEIRWVRPTTGLLTIDTAETVNFSVSCFDEDNDTLTYHWEVDNVPIAETGNSFLFTTLSQVGVQEIAVFISDDNSSISRTWIVETQVQSETSLKLNSQYLFAGTTTDLEVNVTNNLWTGTVDIVLQDPNPLIVKADSDWTFSNVSEGDILSFSLSIFTPLSALGGTGAVVFSVSFSDQHGTNYFEVLSIGLIIRGVIKVTVFSSEISSITVSSGGTVIISATLLNTGNINAYYANASLIGYEGVLVSTSASKSYLGEIEPDSPLPFSLSAKINSSTTAGDYQISCMICYQDEFFSVYTIIIDFEVTVLTLTKTTTGNSGLDFNSLIMGSGIALILGGGTLAAVALIIYQSRKK